jgi:hypothetical protein
MDPSLPKVVVNYGFRFGVINAPSVAAELGPLISRNCCKSRKSNDVKNLAKVDFWPTWPPQYSVTPIRSSLVVLVQNDVVPHIASSETHQWSCKISIATQKSLLQQYPLGNGPR